MPNKHYFKTWVFIKAQSFHLLTIFKWFEDALICKSMLTPRTLLHFLTLQPKTFNCNGLGNISTCFNDNIFTQKNPYLIPAPKKD